MTSCSVDETISHVIIHYLNGKTFTYNDCSVDCFVDWKNEVLNLITELSDHLMFGKYKRVRILDDVMCVEQRDSEGVMIWKNPKYKLSVKTDVMTAKQRAKRNQVKKGRTERLIKCYYDEGYAQGYQDAANNLHTSEECQWQYKEGYMQGQADVLNNYEG